MDIPEKHALITKDDQTQLWHNRLGHINIQSLMKLSSTGAVRGLPKISNSSKLICGDCAKGKQTHAVHKLSEQLSTNKCLELIHMDLMGPTEVESIGGKRYILVVVDDFSRFTWVEFLREKSQACEVFKTLSKRLMTEKGMNIIRIRTDHGKEFENQSFDELCDAHGIKHEFSAPKTPQQNGVVERKNRTLQKMARSMLHGRNVPKKFWAEAVATACYIVNRVYLRPKTEATPYQLWKGRKPSISYFHTFGCVVHILNDRSQLHKFDSKSDEGLFLGYSNNSRAYRVYNKRTQKIIESANVIFDDGMKTHSNAQSDDEDAQLPTTSSEKVVGEPSISIDISVERPSDVQTSEEQQTEDQSESSEQQSVRGGPRAQKHHSTDDIIGNVNDERMTRRKQINFKDLVGLNCFVANYEPKNVEEALLDEFWIAAMQDELLQFHRNDVWTLVKQPEGVNVIGTKWIFKNKTDEFGNTVRNKARLVAQGYSQIEGMDYDETFAPVARIESVRLLLSISCSLKIKLFQMDVKTAFLNGIIKEDIYVAQPKGFED